MFNQDLHIPNEDELLSNLNAISNKSDSVRRCREANRNGVFISPDGRTDNLSNVTLTDPQLALIAHFAKICPKPLSIEFGFGMGSSTSIILGTRTTFEHAFEHIVFDPYGLGDRGQVVEDYLNSQFNGTFRRDYRASEIGGAALLAERGNESVGLAFIDGSHAFEHVMTDFLLADKLCCIGGYIIFDDALYPAIESAINYIIANRPDYIVANRITHNTTVLRKISEDTRSWEVFKPFEIPNRCDWTIKSD